MEWTMKACLLLMKMARLMSVVARMTSHSKGKRKRRGRSAIGESAKQMREAG